MVTESATHTNGSGATLLEATGTDPRPVGPDDPVAAAIRAALLTADERIRQSEPLAREGNAEGVHRMRTGARRLRSELRMYRDLVDGGWDGPLAQELKWLGRLIGAVRDSDVLSNRLRESAGALVVDLGPLFTRLSERHESARAAMLAGFDSPRYHELLERLATLAAQPPLRPEADEPCRTLLPGLVYKSWKRLRKAGRALDLSAPDEEFHEVRKRAKNDRYCAETASSILDDDTAAKARRFARRARAVQDVLGEHQDAVVAGHEIEQIATTDAHDVRFALVAGRLLERQALTASAARTEFFRLWHKLDQKKNLRWMKD